MFLAAGVLTLKGAWNLWTGLTHAHAAAGYKEAAPSASSRAASHKALAHLPSESGRAD